MRAALACAATIAVASAGIVVASPASAVVYTATGERCTIVGTSAADTLLGTAGRDVICGRGGNDVIRARGGNDLVDAGGGADRVSGGDGTDRVIAGSGNDRLYGDAGSDVLRGGTGNDVVSGGSGNDDLYGQDGNDDLTGGAGADDVLGGDGTNWCLLDAADEAHRCVYDLEIPEGSEVVVTPDQVDVTGEAAVVTVRAHLTDDTGVQYALAELTGVTSLGRWMTLERGTVRDGWWSTTITVPRYFEPGAMTGSVSIIDRVNRHGSFTQQEPALTVADDNPDRVLPSVLALSKPTSDQTFDVREDGRRVVVRARVADSQSGVRGVVVGLVRPDGTTGDIDLPWSGATRTSGTIADGWWEGWVEIPRDSPSGDWNVVVQVMDRAHVDKRSEWMGQGLYTRYEVEGSPRGAPRFVIPDGDGAFKVIGDDTLDASAPELVDLSATPRTVDTLPGPVEVTVSAHVLDDVGAKSVSARVYRIDGGSDDPSYSVWFTLASGTKQDGVWTGRVTLPQGAPPGDYGFEVLVSDGPHSSSYANPDDDHPTNYGWQQMAWDPRVTNEHVVARVG